MWRGYLKYQIQYLPVAEVQVPSPWYLHTVPGPFTGRWHDSWCTPVHPEISTAIRQGCSVRRADMGSSHATGTTKTLLAIKSLPHVLSAEFIEGTRDT